MSLGDPDALGVTEEAVGAEFAAAALRDEELEALGVLPLLCSRGEALCAVLRTPAMGDAKVPDIVQLVHQYTLCKRGLSGGRVVDAFWTFSASGPKLAGPLH